MSRDVSLTSWTSSSSPRTSAKSSRRSESSPDAERRWLWNYGLAMEEGTSNSVSELETKLKHMHQGIKELTR